MDMELVLRASETIRDVYGDSVDKIVQGNASNIVFLKSTDDDMLKTLETMSGTTHVSSSNSKTITVDKGKLTSLTRNEDTLSYNVATEERPVISFNDMAFIPDRNSMVFRAGDSPIWNRQEMILPMSWRLFQNTIVNPGNEYSLQTVPTLSTAMDFDVRKNQPDFNHWFNKRLSQMTFVDEAVEKYKDLHGYTDRDIELLDPDIYADDIMRIINSLMHPDLFTANEDDDYPYEEKEAMDYVERVTIEGIEDNKPVIDSAKEYSEKKEDYERKVYAHNTLGKGDFVSYMTGASNRTWDRFFDKLFQTEWQKFYDDRDHFLIAGGREEGHAGRHNLMSANGNVVYFAFSDQDVRDATMLADNATDPNTKVYAENAGDPSSYASSITVTDDFYKYLVSLTPGEFKELAGGAIEKRLYDIQNGN